MKAPPRNRYSNRIRREKRMTGRRHTRAPETSSYLDPRRWLGNGVSVAVQRPPCRAFKFFRRALPAVVVDPGYLSANAPVSRVL
jgi:hypothetical protein